MKKMIFMLTMLVGFTAFGQDEVAEVAVATAGAQIEFENDVFDYGEVKYGADGSSTFTFTNTGNSALVISHAQGSCGCTVPSWPKHPIAPGESAELKVNYNTKKAGAINKSVKITSNAVNASTKVIRIKGNVLPQGKGAAPVAKTTIPATKR